MEALLLVAFAVALSGLAADWPLERRAGPRVARAIPLAVLALGAVYSYSFPGLVWLGGALGVWAVVELVRSARAGGAARAIAGLRAAAPTALVALGVLVVLALPEAGRMVDFANFETFNPAGSGLGNLFNRLSPLEALGIWPSGDFRVEPGDGAIPAAVFYLGALVAAAALAFGLLCAVRDRERAIPAALGAALLLWLYSLVAGTPYQEAKALVLVAPLAMLIAVAGLLDRAPTLAQARRIVGRRALSYAFPGRARVARLRLAAAALAVLFVAGAGVSSLVALANGPVGPTRLLARARRAAHAAAVGLDRRRRATRAARRPARRGLDRLGVARQPHLRRRRRRPAPGRDQRDAHGRARRRRRRRARRTARALRGAGRPGPVPADPGRRPRRSERGRLTGEGRAGGLEAVAQRELAAHRSLRVGLARDLRVELLRGLRHPLRAGCRGRSSRSPRSCRRR